MTEKIKPAPTVVTAELGSRLAVLHMLYDGLKPQFDELDRRVEEIKSGIKTELRLMAAGAHEIQLRTPGVEGALVLSHTEPVTLQSALLKAQRPELWSDYAKKGDRWELRQVKA